MAPAKPALEAERSCSRGHGNHFDRLLAARAAVGQASRANARADGPGEPARLVAHALARGRQGLADRIEGLLERALGPAYLSRGPALEPAELHAGGSHAARRLRAERLELFFELSQPRLELLEACLRRARPCAASGTLGHVSSHVTRVWYRLPRSTSSPAWEASIWCWAKLRARPTQPSPRGCAPQLDRSTQPSPRGRAPQLERSTQPSPRGRAPQLERSTQPSPRGCA